MHHKENLKAYCTGPKFTKFVVVVIFSSTVLTQQSALRSVHPLSNDGATLEKKKVISVKHLDAGWVNNGTHKSAKTHSGKTQRTAVSGRRDVTQGKPGVVAYAAGHCSRKTQRGLRTQQR